MLKLANGIFLSFLGVFLSFLGVFLSFLRVFIYLFICISPYRSIQPIDRVYACSSIKSWNILRFVDDSICAFSSMTVRELIRRASSAARGVSGLETRDVERDDPGVPMPPLQWPTEPPPSYDSCLLQSGQLDDVPPSFSPTSGPVVTTWLQAICVITCFIV